MLVHEMYGSYYRAVSAILARALEGPVTRAEMGQICNALSYGDSALNIPAALTRNDWPLLRKDGTAILTHAPTLPLTLLERRWLKAISLDRRVQLFDADFSFLGDVQPLFTPDDILCFDRSGGDDYDDPVYREVFRVLLTAVQEKRRVKMTYVSQRGKTQEDECTPLRLEYSEKDDRFRVLCATATGVMTRTVSGVQRCELLAPHQGQLPDPDRREARRVCLEITDYRNTLERMSLHFTHLRKEVERAGERRYRMTLWYDPSDEREMVIRVLQFGPMVKVLEPATFREEIRARILRQAEKLGGSQEISHDDDGVGVL